MEAIDIFSYFLLLLLLLSGVKVVTTSNVIHAAIFLVFTLATTAVLFILLSAEFVALVLILVYIGAVIVLFLFGVMITRAPLGPNAELDNDQNKLLGEILLSRFVFPFELVSFVLLGALIGGITLARKDNALMDEDQI